MSNLEAARRYTFQGMESIRFSIRRLRNNRVARALTVVAVLAFIFLLSPHCEFIHAAEAAPAIQEVGHHDHSRGTVCPSLDHMSAVVPDGILHPAPAASPGAPAAAANLSWVAGFESRHPSPRATSPPLELPLYLHYAHLLM